MEKGKKGKKGRWVLMLLLAVLLPAGGGQARAMPDVCVYVIDAETRAAAMAELSAWLAVLQDGDVAGQLAHIQRAAFALDELDGAGGIGCAGGATAERPQVEPTAPKNPLASVRSIR